MIVLDLMLVLSRARIAAWLSQLMTAFLFFDSVNIKYFSLEHGCICDIVYGFLGGIVLTVI